MTRMPGFVVSSIFALALVVPSVAAGQDQSWLKKNLRNDPKRYEGLLDQPNARREYDVMSFIAVPDQALTLAKDSQLALHVSYFVPERAVGSDGKNPVYIRVKQLKGRVNYLMKSYDPDHNPGQWNQFSWPEKTVISESPVDAKNLGVIVRLGSDNEYAEDLAPALFYTESSLPGLKINRYNLILKIQEKSLASLSYRWNYESASGSSAQAVRSPAACFYSAAEPCAAHAPREIIDQNSTVTLQLDLANVPPGYIRVSIEGEYHNEDGKLLANYRFYHQSDKPKSP